MESVNYLSSTFNTTINRTIGRMTANNYIKGALILFIMLYASVFAFTLPKKIALLLNNTIVKIIFAALILFVMFAYDPTVAIVIAIAFYASIIVMNKYILIEKMENSQTTPSTPEVPTSDPVTEIANEVKSEQTDVTTISEVPATVIDIPATEIPAETVSVEPTVVAEPDTKVVETFTGKHSKNDGITGFDGDEFYPY